MWAGFFREGFEGLGNHILVCCNPQGADDYKGPAPKSVAKSKPECDQNKNWIPEGETREGGQKPIEDRMDPFLIYKKKKLMVHGSRVRVRGLMSAFSRQNRKPLFQGLPLAGCFSVVAGIILSAVVGMARADGAGEGGAPSASSILRSARAAQMSMHQVFQGKIRRSGQTVPYRFEMDGPIFRYEFPSISDSGPRSVTVRFGMFDATLEVRDAVGNRLPVKFQDEVQGMGVSYEDLALRFLAWPDATLEGSDTVMLSKCWKLRVKSPKGSSSAYREVVMWVSDAEGAFLKSEAYGENGVLLRRLTVRSLQTIGQSTALKQLRAESPSLGGDPSYLDVDGDRIVRPPK